MAYGEIYEGTGEELAERLAALGKAKLKVLVLGHSQHKPYDPAVWEDNERVFREIMKGAPVLPDRSFTAEDFYGPDE